MKFLPFWQISAPNLTAGLAFWDFDFKKARDG